MATPMVVRRCRGVDHRRLDSEGFSGQLKAPKFNQVVDRICRPLVRHFVQRFSQREFRADLCHRLKRF